MARPLRLTKPVAETVRAGHPWVFHDAVDLPQGLGDGDVVDLLDRDGSFVARGTVEPRSPLVFRAWTRDPSEAVNQALVERRLLRSLQLRRAVLPACVTGFRVCNGESDHLPGLQCDLYDNVASLRTDGALGASWEERFVSAVQRVVQPIAVVVRNPKVAKGKARLVSGTLPDPLVITEGDAGRERRFEVDVVRGMKTGFFLDQRANRDLVGTIARDRSVLNLFAYTGGFSVAAALGGARTVVTVDQSKPAIENARRNFVLNGLDPEAHRFVAGDAFAFLEETARRPGVHDLLVVDPPSLAPNRRAVAKAKGEYTRLNRLALTALEPGGLLATSSCSSHISELDFLDCVNRGAREAGRSITVVHLSGAGADHTLLPAFPEGRYLKFALVGVL